jgi:hypothetical protein
MAGTFLSNGYIRIGAPINAIIRGATGVGWKSASGGTDVITLVGDVGATDGHKMVEISIPNAVSRTATERKKIYQAYQRGDTLKFFYHSGSDVFACEGTIKTCSIDDKVNSPTEFTFEASGKEAPVQ